MPFTLLPPSILPSTTLERMDFVVLAFVFSRPVLFVVFLEAHILDVRGKRVSQLLLVTPFIAITVLFLVTWVRFWSLIIHCKKQARRDGIAGKTSQPDLQGFEE